MATSGLLKTNVEYDSYFWFKWSLLGQSTATNTSKISWSCGVYCGHNFYTNAIRMDYVGISAGGTGWGLHAKRTYSNLDKGDHTLASGTVDIPHNADGTQSLLVQSFSGWLYADHDYIASATAYTLPSIPKKATITAAFDLTDVGTPRISFSNPHGLPMDVWIEPNPVSDHLCIRKNIPNTGEYTWVLDAAERDALRAASAGAKTCPIRFGLYTYIGGVAEPDFVDKTYTVTANTATVPVASLSCLPSGSNLPASFQGVYVQGKSGIRVNVSAAGKFGASITGYTTYVGRLKVASGAFTTGALAEAGEITVASTVIDSRGYSTTVTKQITVIPYSAPQITSFAVERQGDGSTVAARVTGVVASVENKNTKVVRVKLNGVTREVVAPAYNIDTTVTFTDIPTDVTLTAEATLVDAFSSVSKSALVPTVAVTMDFHESGKGIAMGKVAEHENLLDVAWDIRMKGSRVAAMTDFPNQLAETGYQKLPGGLMIQWGTSVVGTEDTTINFPAKFSEACYVIVGNPKQYGKQSITFWNFTTTSFTMSSGGIRMNVLWIALGK